MRRCKKTWKCPIFARRNSLTRNELGRCKISASSIVYLLGAPLHKSPHPPPLKGGWWGIYALGLRGKEEKKGARKPIFENSRFSMDGLVAGHDESLGFPPKSFNAHFYAFLACGLRGLDVKPKHRQPDTHRNPVKSNLFIFCVLAATIAGDSVLRNSGGSPPVDASADRDPGIAIHPNNVRDFG